MKIAVLLIASSMFFSVSLSFADQQVTKPVSEDSFALDMSLASAVQVGVMTSVAANIYVNAVQAGTVSRTDLANGLAADYGIGGTAVTFVATTPTVNAMAADMPELAKRSNCTACHKLDRKIVGPAWYDVAIKYKGDADAEKKLIYKVSNGGSGVWGSMPEIPNSRKVSKQDIQTLVRFILTLNLPANYEASDTASNRSRALASEPFDETTPKGLAATVTGDSKFDTNVSIENSISQKLRELQAIRKEGLITEEEFQKTKQQLLNKL